HGAAEGTDHESWGRTASRSHALSSWRHASPRAGPRLAAWRSAYHLRVPGECRDGDMPPAGGAVRDVAIAAVVRASAGAGTVVAARTVSSARDCAVFMAGFLMDSHCDRFTRRPRGPSTGWGLRAPDAVNSAARPPGPAHSLLARRSARGRIT